jgi:hypothetical protein
MAEALVTNICVWDGKKIKLVLNAREYKQMMSVKKNKNKSDSSLHNLFMLKMLL